MLGIDEEGREVLSFIDGHVAWEAEQPASVRSDQTLGAVAGLVRELHDLTAASELAEGEEVVCHNDLSPKNTVYRGPDLRPVAFIDWDIAAPGSRIHDVAHMCWQYAELGPQRPDAAEQARRVRVLCDAYGLEDGSNVVDTILWWQDRCWRGIDAQAEAGVEAMARLRDTGAVTKVRASYDWVFQNRSTLEEALR